MTSKLKILVYILMFSFSFWLMWHTFSYNQKNQEMLVSSKVWSDFGSAIPLIRSFSKGNNWPPQYPLFPGEPSRYHFLFYLTAGLLEKIGFRIDWALNFPSSVGFFLLLFFIWKLAKLLFKDYLVSFLSVVFFLFNGSFSFLDFFAKHPLSLKSFSEILTNSVFPSFGPWNGSQIAAFWNLNIYTNQRHLGLSFALVTLVLLILNLSHRKYVYLIGFLTGSLFFINQAAFAIAGLLILWYFLIRSNLRITLMASALGALPWILVWTQFSPHTIPQFQYQPGFLAHTPLTPLKFIEFWFYNFGLHFLLIPLGFITAPKKAKLLFPPMLILFILPNLFRLSVDMINNHKFFNYFLLLGVMFSANFLIHLAKSGSLGKVMSVLIFPILIFGGVVDFFPIKNDHYYTLRDISVNPDAAFFLNHTPSDAVVLNSTWFYHPASLAGRYVYNGYSYFTWSYGYDQVTREQNTIAIYSAPTKSEACKLLQQANISYVELAKDPEKFIQPNFHLWSQHFTPVYTNSDSGLNIYSVSHNCL